MYYNKKISVGTLAKQHRKSERTIYRWLRESNSDFSTVPHKSKVKHARAKKHSPEIFKRIIELKQEISQRSAPMVHKILKEEFPKGCPSISTIRNFIRDQGLSYKNQEYKQGYIRFQRQKPNDLWQIDIAGVQTIGHLKQLYLIALLDDCSRFIVAAEYFRAQEGKNVIKIVRDAIVQYGRPNQILADNGRQFRSVIDDLGTKYTKLLESLDVKPIFSKPHHPQTKGKLERWFGVVRQMFLSEARKFVEKNSQCTLEEFNQKFKEWVEWYNFKKPHRSLLNKSSPTAIFFNTENRVFKPLQATVNWDKWLYQVTQRKVNKCNQISYKGQNFDVPPGYARLKIEVFELEDKLELYYKDKLLITRSYTAAITLKNKSKIVRKIRPNGTISYMGKWYSIDYKLAGKTVEVQEINNGKTLLIYLNGVLLCSLNQ